MENIKNKESSMKKNIYFKPKLITQTDQEALYNTFPIYVIATLELFILAILQGELNTLSVCMFVMATIIACRTAYKLGINNTKR